MINHQSPSANNALSISACSIELSMDMKRLSAKQRIAVGCALDKGLYKVPRESNVGDVAEELGISRQAASERLRRAHSKIIGEMTDSPDEQSNCCPNCGEKSEMTHEDNNIDGKVWYCFGPCDVVLFK